MNKPLVSLVLLPALAVAARAAALQELSAQAGPSVVAALPPAPAARASAGPIQPLLSCEDRGLHRSIQVFQYAGAGFETYGQAVLGAYRVVNLVCNNAVGLMGAGQPFKCVGVDEGGRVLTFDVRPADGGGYAWNGQPCR